MNDDSAAEGPTGSLIPNNEAIATHDQQRLRDGQLAISRFLRANLFTGAEKYQFGEAFRSSEVYSHPLVILDSCTGRRPYLQK
jgi:hypothetical protein